MKGTYALLVQLGQDTEIKVGKLGKIKFERGTYAYIGSALRALDKRIERHLGEEKKLHWHIDYLLTEAQIVEVLYGEDEEKKECAIAKNLADTFPTVKDFGSSDCRCEGHLFYSKNISNLKDKLISSFRSEGLQPKMW